MVFKSGSYDVPSLIAEIVSYLAATDDFNIIDSDYPGGYALHHVPTNNYISFALVTTARIGEDSDGTDDTYAGGISVVISSGFDTGSHSHTGTVHKGVIPLYRHLSSTNSVYQTTPYNFTVQCWIDKFGLVMTIQNPNNVYWDTGAFAVMEFLPISALEFNDGFVPIMFHVKNNYAQYDGGVIADNRDDCYYLNIRPYNLRTQTDIVYYPRDGYRSDGNSKIYFDFPYFHNERLTRHAPVFHTRRWFRVALSGGMAVGDIINWIDPDGVTVHKYIISEVSSVDTSTKYYYAIPYENAFDYSA